MMILASFYYSYAHKSYKPSHHALFKNLMGGCAQKGSFRVKFGFFFRGFRYSGMHVGNFIFSSCDCRSIMVAKEIFHGVPGILRPFKEFIMAQDLKKGDQIVYYGVPGTCTPFVELLGFALRSLELEQVFVPLVDESKAVAIRHVDNVGMQSHAKPVSLKPKALVVMGGLSMPNVPVTAEQVKSVISKYPDAAVIGVCFMRMFEKAGWLETISFGCLIDANIDPVEVTK